LSENNIVLFINVLKGTYMKKNLAAPMQFNMRSQHVKAIKKLKAATDPFTQASNSSEQKTHGLADLQESTVSLMNSKARNWGFANLPFNVQRQKLGDNLWKITVENPRTKEVILEAEGNGDKIFAYEDNLARMAMALSDKELKITTQCNK
jgi:hypothetical protein